MVSVRCVEIEEKKRTKLRLSGLELGYFPSVCRFLQGFSSSG